MTGVAIVHTTGMPVVYSFELEIENHLGFQEGMRGAQDIGEPMEKLFVTPSCALANDDSLRPILLNDLFSISVMIPRAFSQETRSHPLSVFLVG